MTFAHFTLATRDVATSSLFFQNTLGWTPISQPDNINRTADWINITDNQQLHLLLVEEFEPSPKSHEKLNGGSPPESTIALKYVGTVAIKESA